MSEEFFFQADQITPDDGEVRIADFLAELYPDQRRVRVAFRLSGFQKSLGTAISITGPDDEEITSANIVNIFIPQNEITLHIPESRAKPGRYDVTISLFTLQEVESDLEPGKVGNIRSDPMDSKSTSFSLQ